MRVLKKAANCSRIVTKRSSDKTFVLVQTYWLVLFLCVITEPIFYLYGIIVFISFVVSLYLLGGVNSQNVQFWCDYNLNFYTKNPLNSARVTV